MASGVNVKMGVTGVSQFKQNINQAKSAVKTLDAQLALTEKQFKASGDAEEYMAKKTAELQAKLEAQKTIVDNAESALKKMTDNGVDRASKAYQDLYQQMLKAKGEMLDTEMQMQGVAEAGDEAANGVSDLNHQLEQVGQGISIQNVTDALDKITDGMKNVISKAWDMGKAIVRNTLGAGSWADKLATTASQFKITPEKLYRMRETAKIIDTDADTILAAQDKLKKGLEGQDKDVMGLISAAGFDPNGMSTEDVFWKLGEYIANLGSEEDKVKQSTKAFGKSWRELIPLFSAGREEYNATMEKWSWVGDEGFESLTKMDDAYQKLESEWEAFQRKFEAAMAPALTTAMETITNMLDKFNEYLSTEEGQAMLKQLGETITTLIEDLTNINPEDVANGLKGVVDGIKTGLEWIANNKSLVVGAVEAFIGAWAALEGAKGVATALQLINGIRGLKGGPKGTNGGSGGSGSDPVVKASPFFGTATTAASKAASVLSAAGMLPAVATDMFLNQTNAGRALRDGTDIIEGINKDLEEKAEEIQKNSESFLDNWNPANPNANPIARMIGAKYGIQPAQTPELGSDWNTTGEAVDKTELIRRNARTGLPDIEDAADKMEKAASDLTGGTETQKKSSTEMSQAAGTLQGMPAQVYSAIIAGMSQIKIYVDGMQMSGALTPYINSAMNGALMGLGITK